MNLQRSEGDFLYWQVWQLADAWEGYLATRDMPEISDGGQGVLAAMTNLVESCDTDGL